METQKILVLFNKIIHTLLEPTDCQSYVLLTYTNKFMFEYGYRKLY